MADKKCEECPISYRASILCRLAIKTESPDGTQYEPGPECPYVLLAAAHADTQRAEARNSSYRYDIKTKATELAQLREALDSKPLIIATWVRDGNEYHMDTDVRHGVDQHGQYGISWSLQYEAMKAKHGRPDRLTEMAHSEYWSTRCVSDDDGFFDTMEGGVS